MARAVASADDKPEYGPALAALANDRMRAFVVEYVLTGNASLAVRRAGYGTPTTDDAGFARLAWQLKTRNGVGAAIEEESRRFIRALGPAAVSRLGRIISDPKSKDADALRAIDMVLPRIDPVAAGLVEHRHEHSYRVTLSADEIVKRIAALAAKTGVEPPMLPAPVIDAEAE